MRDLLEGDEAQNTLIIRQARSRFTRPLGAPGPAADRIPEEIHGDSPELPNSQSFPPSGRAIRVTIVFKNPDAAFAPSSDEETIKKQLYPDQQTFYREERRRFEILLAHWDVPIATVDLEQ